MVASFAYGGETIRYEVLFVSSRCTLGIEVHPDSRVLVRAPAGCTPELIAERVRKRAAWISRQLRDFARYRPRTPARQYLSGEAHRYLGRQYRLKVRAGPTTRVRLARGEIIVDVTGKPNPERVRAVLERWYLEQAKSVFNDILDAYLPVIGKTERPRLIVRGMRSRWGSLSRAGTMTLNASLVRAPRPCIEYVIVHEICHLRHRDHGTKFFRLLGQVMPDWECRKERLEMALL